MKREAGSDGGRGHPPTLVPGVGRGGGEVFPTAPRHPARNRSPFPRCLRWRDRWCLALVSSPTVAASVCWSSLATDRPA